MARDPKSKRDGRQPKYNSGTLPRNNNPEIMYDVAGRHLVATFNAFRGLSRFGRENQEAIVDGFLEESVLKDSFLNRNQGWEGLRDPRTEEEINLDSAREGIKTATILDHDNKIFAAKGSEASESIIDQDHGKEGGSNDRY